MAAEILFCAGGSGGLSFAVGARRLENHFQIGHDALSLDGTAGRVIQGYRELGGRTCRTGEHIPAPSPCRRSVRPESGASGRATRRPRLRGRGRTGVDQHHHGHAYVVCLLLEPHKRGPCCPGGPDGTDHALSRKVSDTLTAWSSSPPGLLRRIQHNAFEPARRAFLAASLSASLSSRWCVRRNGSCTQ